MLLLAFYIDFRLTAVGTRFLSGKMW